MTDKSPSQFCKILRNELPNYLADDIKTAEICIENETSMEIASLKLMIDKEIIPAIPLMPYYTYYTKHDDIETVMKAIAERHELLRCTMNNLTSHLFDGIEKEKNVRMYFVPVSLQDQVRKTHPHRTLYDIMIAYRFVSTTKEGHAIYVDLDNTKMKKIGATEDKLFDLAQKNANLDNLMFKPLPGPNEDDLYDMTPDDDIAYTLSILPPEDTASIIINKMVMNEIHDRIGGDFYIAIANIDETMIIPVSMTDQKTLNMFKLTLQTLAIKMPQKALTVNIYRYSENGLQSV